MEIVGCEFDEVGKILGYTKKPPLQREQVEGEFTISINLQATPKRFQEYVLEKYLK